MRGTARSEAEAEGEPGTHAGRSAGGRGLAEGSLPPLPGPPLSGSLTRGHCRLFYSLETTHHKHHKNPLSRRGQLTQGQLCPHVAAVCTTPKSRSRRIRAADLAVRAMNWAAAARRADGVSAGLHCIRVPRHREAWLPVHFHSPCRLHVCCMESYTVFPQVTHLTNLFLKNHMAIWGTTAWSRVCDKGRGTRAALTPRNGFAVPPQGP